MLTLKYPILQSGFLGLSETGLKKQIPQPSTFADTILFRDCDTEYDNLFYSSDVTKLFKRFQSNPRDIRSVDFQHEILEQAMKRFGVSIIDWIDFQSNKPGFSETHKQFLSRMTAWMAADTDIPEYTDALRWIGFLGPGQGHNVQAGVGNMPGIGGMTDVPTAITNWVSKVGGYESLLVHLYVIFGKRVGHTHKLEH